MPTTSPSVEPSQPLFLSIQEWSVPILITKFSSRSLVLACVAAVGSSALVGCGEKEATIIPSNKKKDELQKDIENPYGVEIKTPKVNKKRGGSRSRR